jgi:hypothetical protein
VILNLLIILVLLLIALCPSVPTIVGLLALLAAECLLLTWPLTPWRVIAGKCAPTSGACDCAACSGSRGPAGYRNHRNQSDKDGCVEDAGRRDRSGFAGCAG